MSQAASASPNDLPRRSATAQSGPQSPVHRSIERFVLSPWSLGFAYLWGLAEALSWPLMAEMAMLWFAAAVPGRILWWAGAIVLGSVSGVVLNAALAARDMLVPLPWTTERMISTAGGHLESEGAAGVVNQALNGIPVKVYGQLAGQLNIDLGELAAWTLLGRGLRMAGAAVVVLVIAMLLRKFLRRRYGTALLICLGVYGVLLALVIRQWQ